jgi:hypothetical protein
MQHKKTEGKYNSLSLSEVRLLTAANTGSTPATINIKPSPRR